MFEYARSRNNEITERLYSIPGAVPNPIAMPDYCYFRDRCEKCVEKCSGKYPPEIHVTRDMPREQLLEDCSVLLERLDPDTGMRLDWCRIVGDSGGGWLQWTEPDALACVPLTRDALADVLKILL